MEVGNLSPVEKGNILGLGYISQGVVAKRFSRATIVPYLEATVFKDSKGFDWDNRALVGARRKGDYSAGLDLHRGGRLLSPRERFESGLTASGLSVFTTFSFNWNLLGRKVGR